MGHCCAWVYMCPFFVVGVCVCFVCVFFLRVLNALRGQQRDLEKALLSDVLCVRKVSFCNKSVQQVRYIQKGQLTSGVVPSRSALDNFFDFSMKKFTVLGFQFHLPRDFPDRVAKLVQKR
jgi:hypothetical protein